MTTVICQSTEVTLGTTKTKVYTVNNARETASIAYVISSQKIGVTDMQTHGLLAKRTSSLPLRPKCSRYDVAQNIQ